MPHVDNLEFSSVTSLNMSEFNVIYNHTNPSLPSSGFFSQYSYHKAVDQNMESCWDSYKRKLLVWMRVKLLSKHSYFYFDG